KYVNMQDEAKSAAAKGVIGTVRSAVAINYAKTALAGADSFPVIGNAVTGGTNNDLQDTAGASIFMERTMPDSPVLAATATGPKSLVTSAEDPIATFSQLTAYVYNATTGEVRFNNTAVDPITSKAWSTF
ncbi:MAG: hypothetical protein KAH24_10560, partial [Holophagae bacterium]|nr:hypothetical protein [Holophagae bacterium]